MITLRASEAASLLPNDPRRRWLYNGLDVCATHGAHAEMAKLVAADPAFTRVYDAERRLLAPALAVGMRGIRINEAARPWGARCLKRGMDKLEALVRKMTGHTQLNINSPAQLKVLFFADFGLEEMRNKDGNVSTDRAVLERIRDNVKLEWQKDRAHAPEQLVRDSARAILMHRTWGKEREIYTAALRNGRMRCTLSVGSTETWRFSSAKSPLGDGRNLQNIKKPRRIIFVPDPGFTMYQIDQKQAESLTVAYLCCDPAYINAHLTSDTHIAVAHLCNPDADWPHPSDPDADAFYRQEGWLGTWSIRDAYKRIQHLLNYLGTYKAVARTLHITEAEAAVQVERYYSAFPGIPRFHEKLVRQIKEEGVVEYPGGYKRVILGHRNDPATHRAIMASFGQSIIGWINHAAFAAIWHEFDGSFLSGDAGPPLQVLMHVHDAVLYQSLHEELARQAHALASSIVWPMPAGEMRVPWDFKAGPNWKAVS